MFFDNYFANVSKKQYQTRDLMLVNNISNVVLAVTNNGYMRTYCLTL